MQHPPGSPGAGGYHRVPPPQHTHTQLDSQSCLPLVLTSLGVHPGVAPVAWRCGPARLGDGWRYHCFSTNFTGPLAPLTATATGVLLNSWHWAPLPLAPCPLLPGRKDPSAFYLI